MKAAAKLRYRRKLVTLFLVITLIPLTAFYGYFFFVTNSAAREDLLKSVDAAVQSGAQRVNEIFSENVQKLQMLQEHPLLQTHLRSMQRVRMSPEIYDFYSGLSAIYSAIRDSAQSWNMTIFSCNPNVLSGAFIEPIENMDPVRKAQVLSVPDSVYHFVYAPASGTLQEMAYILHHSKSQYNTTISIEQIRFAFDRIRKCFQVDLSPEISVEFLWAGKQPIPIQGSPAQAKESYRVEALITTSNSRVIALIPKSYLLAQQANALMLLGFGYLLLITLFIVLINAISRMLSQRLYQLIVDINQDLPNLIRNETHPAFQQDDEFGKIGAKFQELIWEIKRHYAERAEMETANKALELELLQSLINPHFLYNTLDGIKWTYRDPRLAAIIDAMVRYYRIALNRGNSILTVAQEMDMIRAYLDIQRFAYESDFGYLIEVTDDIRNMRILKNLIQPVVENAVLHGIKRQSPSDLIQITGLRVGNDLVFQVKDNGVGMPQEKADSVLDGTYKSATGGYGLHNVQQRIQLYYGNGFGLQIQSERNAGTTVTLRIKAEMEPGSLQAGIGPTRPS